MDFETLLWLCQSGAREVRRQIQWSRGEKRIGGRMSCDRAFEGLSEAMHAVGQGVAYCGAMSEDVGLEEGVNDAFNMGNVQRFRERAEREGWGDQIALDALTDFMEADNELKAAKGRFQNVCLKDEG